MNTSWTQSALAVTLSTLLAACSGGNGGEGVGGSHLSETNQNPDIPDNTATARTAINLEQISDVGLRACVEKLNILYTDELQLLNCRAQGVQSLDGIEQFTHTIVANLADNQIIDISPLAALSSMQSLDISNNSLNDISPISQHKALRTLSVSSNRLQNIDPLQNISSLKRLYVQNNVIHDLNIVSNMTNLVSLRADQNPASLPAVIPPNMFYRI